MYSRTRCRVQASHREQSRLGAEVSSGPLFAPAVGWRFELCSNLLSVVLMKDPAQRSGCSPDWLKMKISNAPAEKREAEEESGKKRGENHDLGARGPFCLTLQNGGCLGPLQTDVEATRESARAVCRCLIGDRALISPAERSR